MWATTEDSATLLGLSAADAKKKRKLDMPLEKHISTRRAQLEAELQEVPGLRMRARKACEQMESCTARHQVREKAELQQEVRDLEQEVAVRESLTRPREFEMKVAPYLQAYSQRVEFEDTSNAPRNITAPGGVHKRKETIDSYVQQHDATVSRQTAVLNEFLFDTTNQPPKLAMNTRDECPLCLRELQLITSKAIMTCASCGYAVAYLDATMSSMSYSDDVEFSSFSYKRINHFNEWLQQVQAKENFELPEESMLLVMNELYKQRITLVGDITQKKVREVLKILKLRKSYEHVAQITSKLTGTRPMRVPAETEEMCRLMFIAVQPVFEIHCPKDRKNFLSYSYCLYKFFQLLGFDQFLDSFALLKGRDKLHKQDDIFRKICADLDWEFVPSV